MFFPILACLLLASAVSHADDPVLPVTNVNHDTIARAAVGAILEDLPGGILTVLYPETNPTSTIFEERHGGSYDQAAFVYAPLPRHPRLLTQVVAVHYRSADTLLAQKVLRLIGRLLRLHRENFGRDTAFPQAATTAGIWLNAPAPPQDRDAGGETWTHHVYLFQTATPRTPLEWVRTIVHEWGHLTLPAARGFSDPERDASGYLGERLYFKWLSEDAENDGDDFVSRKDLELYYHRQIAPLIADYHLSGPASPLLRRTNTEAMDYYIGGILAADDAFGSTAVGRALFSIESEAALDFNRTMRTTLENSASFQVRLPAWVPLEEGTYTLHASGVDQLLIADRPPVNLRAGDQTLIVRLSGWKWMQSQMGTVKTITFHLVRSGKAE
jgi:hypothetical protein